MRYFVLLNEINLLRTLLLAVSGREVYLIDVEPVFARSRPLLRRIAAWLVASSRACDAYADCPEARHIFNRPAYCDYTDIFVRIEPWVGEHFRFAAADGTGSPYLLPYKHTAWSEVWKQADHALTIDAVLRGPDAEGAVFIGLNSTLAGMCRAYTGRRPRGSVLDWWPARRLYNLGQAAGVFAYVLVWSLVRVRPAMPPVRSFLMGSTYANRDDRLIANLDDIVGDRGQVCMVFYRQSIIDDAEKHLDLTGFPRCLLGDGVLTPATFLAAAGLALRDLAGLYARFGGVRHTQFRDLAKLVWHRVAYRALFRTYRFRYFWGRDEYNADHMIRSQELRRIGGVSFGTHHGIATTAIVGALRWYQDFDVLFVFGRHYYETYCKDALPPSMEIIPMGAFGLTRKQLAGIPSRRNRDIVVFTNLSIDNQCFVDVTLALAEAFPDRTVYFKCKGGYERAFHDFLNGTPPAPDNVVIAASDSQTSYRLITECGYAISAHSTVGIEAMYYGMKTFIIDNQPAEYPYYFRDFPGLCFKDPGDVIAKIRRIESGAEEYPWARYDGLVDMSNRNPHDIVRARMGLPPLTGDDIVPGMRDNRRPAADRQAAAQ